MGATAIRTFKLPSGESIPALGQGTWHLGETTRRRKEEIATLRLGLDLGLCLIDTAEMYADGATEDLVGEAIDGRRDEVFLVSKVLPQHGSVRRCMKACEQSLLRLGTDHIDLYLLHWRGPTPLAETFEAFEKLRDQGKIRYFGVSNFDNSDLADLSRTSGATGPRGSQVNQVLYNLKRRGIEFDLMSSCRERRMPIMAYSPVEQGRLLDNAVLAKIGERHRATAAQVALAWVLRQDFVCAIPKASNPAHVRENRAALDLELSADDLAELDREFPPPKGAAPLEMI
jgi:diketogulonate reductase-like aldo/keto reductase